MKSPGHLRIEELKLAPGQEWTEESSAWRFVRIKAIIRASQLNEVLLHGFKFAPDLLCGFFTLDERHLFEIQGHEVQARFLPSTHPIAEQFAALITEPERPEDLARRAEVLGLAAAFFTEGLLRHPVTAPRGISAQQRFQEIVCRMPDIEIVQHTPEELAGLCGCSTRHFNRLFREHFGEPPRARQTELRLLKARQLLATTDSKVIQVALDSGYRSLSLFNSLFKRRFGMSPSEYRETTAKDAPRAA